MVNVSIKSVPSHANTEVNDKMYALVMRVKDDIIQHWLKHIPSSVKCIALQWLIATLYTYDEMYVIVINYT